MSLLACGDDDDDDAYALFFLLFVGLRLRSLHKKQRVLLVYIVLRIGGGRWVLYVTTMIPYEDNNELTTAPLGL